MSVPHNVRWLKELIPDAPRSPCVTGIVCDVTTTLNTHLSPGLERLVYFVDVVDCYEVTSKLWPRVSMTEMAEQNDDAERMPRDSFWSRSHESIPKRPVLTRSHPTRG